MPTSSIQYGSIRTFWHLRSWCNLKSLWKSSHFDAWILDINQIFFVWFFEPKYPNTSKPKNTLGGKMYNIPKLYTTAGFYRNVYPISVKIVSQYWFNIFTKCWVVPDDISPSIYSFMCVLFFLKREFFRISTFIKNVATNCCNNIENLLITRTWQNTFWNRFWYFFQYRWRMI